MADFKISFHPEKLLEGLDPSLVKKATAQALAKAGFFYEAEVNAKLAKHNRSGRIWVHAVVVGNKVYVGSNYLPLLFLEVGTKPHEIRPKNKKVLAWPGGSTKKSASGLGRGPQGVLKANGGYAGFAHAKVVHHPGTKANHYLEDTMKSTYLQVSTIFRNALIAALP